MNEQQDKRSVGRPAIYDEDRKPVTTFWPVSILHHIDQVADNRTRWLIEAAQEKMEREQSETE